MSEQCEHDDDEYICEICEPLIFATLDDMQEKFDRYLSNPESARLYAVYHWLPRVRQMPCPSGI